MKDLLGKIFTEQTYKASLPYILIVIGAFCFIYSIFGTFEDARFKEVAHGFGMSILAGGIFALLLKSLQFMGVFKDELTKVIFEPRYLSNRKDLPEYWEKISKELFKNKFSRISDRITRDVIEVYLPTQSIQYYDDMRQRIEIEMVNESIQLVKVKESTKFTLYAKDGKKEFLHEFRNSIFMGTHEPFTSYKVTSIKINSEEYINNSKKTFTLKTDKKDGLLITNFGVLLSGYEVYTVEKIIEKTYSILTDNIMSLANDCIRNNLNVQFFLEGIKIDFYSSGTLKNFVKNHERKGYMEMSYNGLLYPKQGYFAVINKLN